MSWFRALWKVVGKYNAPALSSVPSMPSVSQAIADTRGRCCFDRSKSVMANARRNSVLHLGQCLLPLQLSLHRKAKQPALVLVDYVEELDLL